MLFIFRHACATSAVIMAVSGFVLYLGLLGCDSDCKFGQHDEEKDFNSFYTSVVSLTEVMLSWKHSEEAFSLFLHCPDGLTTLDMFSFSF